LSCKFCAIARGEADAARVYEDDEHLAFLDIRPLFIGHVLLIPKPHHETLADLPVERVGPLFVIARRLSAVVEEVLAAEGSFVAMNNKVSQSVPHLHVHVVPRRKKDGLKGFFWPRTRYASDDDLQTVAAALRHGMGA
jgi:histidine triad (HIT) family protein